MIRCKDCKSWRPDNSLEEVHGVYGTCSQIDDDWPHGRDKHAWVGIADGQFRSKPEFGCILAEPREAPKPYSESPLPWRQESEGSRLIVDANGREVARANVHEDAAFIVAAVNALAR